MARCHWSLMCSPQPIARLLRALPKLAIIFLAVHFTLMIYSIVNQPSHISKTESKKNDSRAPVGIRKPAVDHIRLAGIIAYTGAKAQTGNVSRDRVDRLPSRFNKTKLEMSEMRKKLANINNKRLGRTSHMLV